MPENFIFSKMTSQHQKRFITHKAIIFILIAIMTFIAIDVTNPSIVSSSDKISLTIGASIGFGVMVLAFFNRIKTLLKIKFVVFLITWVLLFSLQMIMTTLVWTIGLVLIPLMIDDLFIVPYWRNLWYNTYE